MANLFETPIASGVLNGVMWESKTTIEGLQVAAVKHAIFEANRRLKAFGIDKVVGHAEAVRMIHNKSVFELIDASKFDRFAFYMSSGRYHNNKSVRV